MTRRNQQDEGVERSLALAGISQRFWRTSLSQYAHPDAARILEWVNGKSKATTGEGWTFVGGNQTLDLAVLTARALHVTGRGVRVYPILRFCELLGADRDYLEEQLDRVGTLLITEAAPRRTNEVIFTDRELRSIENRLTRWLDEGRRLLLHMNSSHGPSWFSGDFLQRVAEVNQTIEALP